MRSVSATAKTRSAKRGKLLGDAMACHQAARSPGDRAQGAAEPAAWAGSFIKGRSSPLFVAPLRGSRGMISLQE